MWVLWKNEGQGESLSNKKNFTEGHKKYISASQPNNTVGCSHLAPLIRFSNKTSRLVQSVT